MNKTKDQFGQYLYLSGPGYSDSLVWQSEDQIFKLLAQKLYWGAGIWDQEKISLIPDYAKKFIRANYLAYQYLPSAEKTVELALISVNQYIVDVFTKVTPIELLRYSLPILEIVPQSETVYEIINSLYKKQMILDSLSGQDDLSQILASVPGVVQFLAHSNYSKHGVHTPQFRMGS